MNRLIHHFDGGDKVTVLLRDVGFDRLVCLDAAHELGYVFSPYHNTLRPTTRWYEGWIIFISQTRAQEGRPRW